jgi:hypothetical protein
VAGLAAVNPFSHIDKLLPFQVKSQATLYSLSVVDVGATVCLIYIAAFLVLSWSASASSFTAIQSVVVFVVQYQTVKAKLSSFL